MQHTSWTASQGAPTGVFGITQTPDGWLWVGSSAGLFRFDGLRFFRAEGMLAPLSANIFSLGVFPDGTLWVTYRFGGVSLMKAGRMQHFRAGDKNTPPGTLSSIAQDADGRVWLGSAQGLRVLSADGTWKEPDAGLGAPSGYTRSMLLDRSGAFWLRTSDAVYGLPKHGTRFERKMKVGEFGMLGEHPDGSVWTSDDRPGLQLVAGPPGTDPHAWMPDNVNLNFIFDHSGNLWMATASGVTRSGPPGPARQQHTNAEQGLSGMHGDAVFEDREHNIWVGTENGLDRFRSYRLKSLALPRYLGEGRPLAAGVNGGAWIDGSYLSGPDATPVQFAPLSSNSDSATALHAAPDGTLWSGGIGGMWTVRDGKRSAVPMPPGLRNPLATPVFALATDAAGTLWASLGRLGVFAMRDGQWSKNGAIAGLESFPTTAIANDLQGRMWFGSVNNQIRLLGHGNVQRFGPSEGVEVGTVLAIASTPGNVWIGGENGISYFDGKRFVLVKGHAGEPFVGTSGLVFGGDGTLWLNGGAGISSIAPGELQQALRDPAYRVHFERLDYRDGLMGTVAPVIPLPSAIRTKDGTLWFSTQSGVFAFNPATLTRNALVPPVYVGTLKAGGKEYPAVDGLRLPPHTSALEVSFTALSYRSPERMDFRYMLEGVDQGWQNSDGRRFAQYTGLAPGRYRFRVIASNDDGVWNKQGATLSFEIAPSLTQTTWFRVLCGLAVLLGLWLLHRMRLRQLASRMAKQMNTRIEERERIARELHDTLLQSIMGLVLKIGAAIHRLRDDERQPLEDALVTARQVLGEGRDRVAGLRGASLQYAGLGRSIGDFGASLAQGTDIRFDLSVKGDVVLLDDAVSEEVLAIAREAVWNAFVHAHPRSVSVELDYAAGQLAMTVRDDGCGLPAEVIAQDGRAGHWGMPGLRERAAKIGGALVLFSREGEGTTWRLQVPQVNAMQNMARAA